MGLKIESDLLLSTNPRNGEVISEFESIAPENMPGIMAKARSAFEDWSSLTLKTRLELFRKAYRQFYEDQDEIAQLISDETGKPLVEAFSSEIMPILDCFKYYLKNIQKFLKTHKVGATNPLFKLRKGIVRYKPLGVLGVISPWNYPFLLSMQHIIPAILAGNVVVHKPSEYTSLTGLKIREIFDRAYLPKGVLEIVTGLSDVGQALVSSGLDKIIFTGSTAVGRKIYQSAAQNLVPVNMELGGSDAMIVFEDANLDRAVNAAVWGAFTNTGQACVSIERLYVHESIMDEFVERLVEKAKNVSLGNHEPNNTDVSCLVNEQQLSKIQALVKDASEKGAVILLGGKARQDLGDLYFEPTIISNTNSSMNLTDSEIFGPVVLIAPFISEDEAIFMANDSEFGLSASIWTQSHKKGLKLAKRIQVGSVIVNDLHIHVAQVDAPYTGFKNSGIGVSHGPWGVMEVVQPQYISTERRFARTLFRLINKRLISNNICWFKYNETLVDDFKSFTDFLHGNSIPTKLKAIPAVIKALFRKNYLS